MTVTIDALDVRTHFSGLLARVVKGETITIAQCGVPVAQLSPVSRRKAQAGALAAVSEMRAARAMMRLDGLSAKDLVCEGRN